jgi:signal recognition particle receptor subunit beta
MVLINKAINEVTVKLVYYGPGLCGKTTNLEKIYANPKLDNKGKMISMSTETDRTLFFDFMPMELGTIAGQKVRVQLYTVPGQVFYDATRKLVLRGADGVVFVADSQNTMRESNLVSLENLKTNLRLNRLDPDKVAIVYQYNKRDLPNIDSVETMNEYMKPNGRPVVEAAAKAGTGVTATLRAAVAKILDNLKNNVDTTLYEQPELAAPDMTQRSGVTGPTKLSMKTDAAPAAPPKPVEVATAVEEDPFGASVAVAEPEPEPEPELTSIETDPFGAGELEPEAFAEAIEDPFAETTQIHDTDAERADLETMLANAQAIVASLETALERARDTEKKLAAKLSK